MRGTKKMEVMLRQLTFGVYKILRIVDHRGRERERGVGGRNEKKQVNKNK